MSRIGADHLAREAIVYVRQSTADQVLHNVESRRRQYGLVERARQLGWAAVSVIDDDLGRSGSGVSRPGFEKLLAAICEGRVGAVVSVEASRLARNGRAGAGSTAPSRSWSLSCRGEGGHWRGADRRRRLRPRSASRRGRRTPAACASHVRCGPGAKPQWTRPRRPGLRRSQPIAFRTQGG